MAKRRNQMTSVAFGSIKGRLVGPGDKGLAGPVKLQLQSEKGLQDTDSKNADGNGDFVFPSVADGDYVLTFQAELNSGGETFKISGNTTRQANIRKGQPWVVDAIRYEPATGASTSSTTTPPPPASKVRGRLV